MVALGSVEVAKDTADSKVAKDMVDSKVAKDMVDSKVAKDMVDSKVAKDMVEKPAQAVLLLHPVRVTWTIAVLAAALVSKCLLSGIKTYTIVS